MSAPSQVEARPSDNLGAVSYPLARGSGQYQCEHLNCSSALAKAPLPSSLRSFVRETIYSISPDGGYDELDVYGPGSRRALVKAPSSTGGSPTAGAAITRPNESLRTGRSRRASGRRPEELPITGSAKAYPLRCRRSIAWR